MVVSVEKKHLDYFKDLVEGNASVAFSAYLRKNEQSLKEQFARAQFLRLKFDSIDEIIKILDESGIEYKLSNASINMEKYLMNFHPDVLDENGRIKKSHRDTMFNGAVRLFYVEKNKAKSALHKFLGIPKRLSEGGSIEHMEDVEAFAEIELRYGDVDLGLFLLREIASIGRQYTDVDDITTRVRERLREYDKGDQ